MFKRRDVTGSILQDGETAKKEILSLATVGTNNKRSVGWRYIGIAVVKDSRWDCGKDKQILDNQTQLFDGRPSGVA